MRSSRLQVSLHDFAEQASAALADVAASGSEVPFEVTELAARRSGPVLYCYRALTGEFIDRHSELLHELPAYLPALHALTALDGLSDYLDSQAVPRPAGGRREMAEAALRHFAERILDGAEQGFELTPEHFDEVFGDLERAAEGRVETVVLALLHGVGAEADQVDLGDGAQLVALHTLEEPPPDPAWTVTDESSLVVVLAGCEGAQGAVAARERLSELRTTLRLLGPGIDFEPLAWVRCPGAPWRPLAVAAPRSPSRARTASAPHMLAGAAEEELRAFCGLVARRRPTEGTVAWAMERFELGCERDDPLRALTDHLLALRALLEPEGARSGRLAGRVAALCAVESDRPALAERVAHAISLEQSAIAGLEVAPGDAVRLAGEMEAHLRALLRDVLCGHLAPPLDRLADELIEFELEAAPESGPTAEDTRHTHPIADRRREPVLEPGEDFLDELEPWGEAGPDQIALANG